MLVFFLTLQSFVALYLWLEEEKVNQQFREFPMLSAQTGPCKCARDKPAHFNLTQMQRSHQEQRRLEFYKKLIICDFNSTQIKDSSLPAVLDSLSSIDLRLHPLFRFRTSNFFSLINPFLNPSFKAALQSNSPS